MLKDNAIGRDFIKIQGIKYFSQSCKTLFKAPIIFTWLICHQLSLGCPARYPGSCYFGICYCLLLLYIMNLHYGSLKIVIG